MIPENSIKVREVTTRMLAPDTEKESGLIDYERGGVEYKDPSQGYLVANWAVEVSDKYVNLYKEGKFKHLLLVQPNIADIAFCFDQTMNVMLAWRTKNDQLYLRYYDSFLARFEVMSLGMGKCPRLTLDDKRSIAVDSSDVIFAYIANGSLCYRQQRESFFIEHVIRTDLHPSQRLDRIGMGGLQLQFELSSYIEDM